MKKKILALILVSGLLLSLGGCAQKSTISNPSESSSNSSRFINTGESYDSLGLHYKICYDRNTEIMYILCGELTQAGSPYTVSISVMYDMYGKPMTLNEYNKTK
jgi:phospholipase/lecithinase/hemolysin